jgi:hypothetical protein
MPIAPYLSYEQLVKYVDLDSSCLENDKYKNEIQKEYEKNGLGVYEIPLCVTENIYNQIVASRTRIIKISGFGYCPDIDNMFLTVSDPGTDRYNIDIWEVDLITKNLQNKFEMNIGNWNVVYRNDYKMFASNISIYFTEIPKSTQLKEYYLEKKRWKRFTFIDALHMGISIEINSFVTGYKYDCEKFSFDLTYGNQWFSHKICYKKLNFHNYLSGKYRKREDIELGDHLSDCLSD